MANYKVVDADKLDADLQTVADAIKAKAGTEEAMEFPSGFASAVESIETGGGADHTQEDGLIKGTLTEYTNDRVAIVRTYAFYRSSLKSVNLPSVRTAYERAFDNCGALVSVNMPSLKTWGTGLFNACKSLTSIHFPQLKYSASSTDSGHFYGCSKLKDCFLPNYEGMIYLTFNNCTALERADLGRANSFYSGYAINGCQNLKSLILRKTESICSLGSADSITNTSLNAGGTGGTVYVPRALIESYQTATNWSTLYAAGTCTFLALEDYTVDGTTTGEIDWDKINGGVS